MELRVKNFPQYGASNRQFRYSKCRRLSRYEALCYIKFNDVLENNLNKFLLLPLFLVLMKYLIIIIDLKNLNRKQSRTPRL